MVQLLYAGGHTSYRPLACLEAMESNGGSLEDRLRKGLFGKVRDLRRLITYEKLKGALHDVIYSMEAAQIDFYPYQFKPVLKFINSPTERLIIADEVGLGKTIESSLIWIELQARRQAQRLLVICPKILANKWRDELREKFLLDARVVSFEGLSQEIKEVKKVGSSHSFVLIATYTGLRPPRAELSLLEEPPDVEPHGLPKTKILRELYHWPLDYDPFDLVIFDEAHYMRNPATTTFHLGKGIATNAGAVLCVSATPVNNSNTDLHSLLRLTDESFFETQGLFEELLDANRPAVQACNALARTPVDKGLLEFAIKGMKESKFISESPLFKQFIEKTTCLDLQDKEQIAKCQDLGEKLNLLGGYINRTRRVQVKENRPIRVPHVLTIQYSPEEMQLYQTILQIVRNKCIMDNRRFHVFQVMGLQLRTASCLPVIAKEIRDGRFGDPRDLFDESLGGEVLDDFSDEDIEEDLSQAGVEKLLEYDFEGNDSKYRKLKQMLYDLDNEKIIIFAYYRPTLAYLQCRLVADGINVASIHGGILNEQRWREIERFEDPHGPRILLSSEVGSEGIDLQFCRVMINYDLPWNPMRVEQRIGRIDRVGQQAKRLTIVNFKVQDTIEERLYDRLHSKLDRFANSLGDLESVIGKEVQNLTIELLSRELTMEEQDRLIDQSERAIEGQLLQMQTLEESGDTLIALSDYVQRKIEENRGKGRYLLPNELEEYMSDFFEREFQGCEISYNTPYEGCMHIKLTHDASYSLSSFVRDDRSLSARPLRRKDFAFTFRREALQRLPVNQRRSVHFMNHISPFIRWITKINREREHIFFDTSSILISHEKLPPGDYCYRIERWKLKGLSLRETLAYGIGSLSDGRKYSAEESEIIVQYILRNGKDWDYVDCDKERLIVAHKKLEEEMGIRFSEAVTNFDAENITSLQIKTQRVRGFFDRRIEQDKKRLQTSRDAKRGPQAIRLAEGRLQAALRNKERKLIDLKTNAKIDIEQAQVAAGVFCVTGS